MRLPFLIPLFAVLTLAQNISFINPGPAGPDSVYSNDPSFAYGSKIVIEWTPTSQIISMVIYQQTQGAAFEYIFQNKQGFSSYDWHITTTKSLAVSRIFFFEIFIEGQTAPVAVSHYFNITGDAASAASSSSSTSTSHTSTTLISKATSSTTHTSTSTPSHSSSPSPTPGSGGLSTGAKVGLGVGIPVAVIAGLLAGWFCFAWKRKSDKKKQEEAQWPEPQQHPGMQQAQSPPAVYEYRKQGPILQPYHGGMRPTHELDDSQTHEMDARGLRSPAELGVENDRWK